MHIVVVGLNYKTAPVDIREKFSVAEDELEDALNQLKQTKSIMECVIVATCNRTEVYAVVDRLHPCGHFIRDFMEKWFGVPREHFNPHLYIREDEEAIRHLLRVTSGLDSMVIGETQILGQVRDSFLFAQQRKMTGTLFNTLFKQAVTMAKRAHSETGIGENAVSVSYAAVELGKQIFGEFKGKTVVIIGAGKMSELTAKHLHANGVSEVAVINRTAERAEQLAEKFNGAAGSIDDLPEWLTRADIVISSTGSRGYVLQQEAVEEALRNRKTTHPLFMIDIAVPRDLDPAIADLDNVYLYDIDDLEGIVESNVEQRRHEAEKIEEMIEQEILDFYQWFRTLGVGPVIRALQEKSSNVHREVMDDLLRKLPELDEREVKVIRKLTKSIVNQMLQDPILRIKEMAGEKDGDESLAKFIQFFALEEQVERIQQQSNAPLVMPRNSKKKEERKKNASFTFTLPSSLIRS